ncbi:MAG TPA: sigma-70 family RNA polymerase sigma factor [Syntrophomonadaceae bacterium]|nr:sigma-70 family RNA polymerase sigma factor [Syntrophomonadaceae bacterium]
MRLEICFSRKQVEFPRNYQIGIRRWLIVNETVKHNIFKGDPDEARVVSWLITGLKHEAMRLKKKMEKIQKHELLILNDSIKNNNEESHVEIIDTIASSINLLSEVEDMIFLQELLSLLTPLQQKVIRSIFLNGATEKEVSQELGISQPAVYRIKKRALNRLRKILLSVD